VPAPKPQTTTKVSLFETDDGPGLLGYEIAATGEKELQSSASAVSLGSSAPRSQVSCEPGVGYDVGVFGVGLGLSAVGVTGPVHGEAGYVETTLWPRSHRAAPARVPQSHRVGLSPRDDVLRKGKDLFDEG
jgi:hypothetical protein